MRSLEKIWTVVYAIDEAQKITPSGQFCLLRTDAIHHLVDEVSTKAILAKLEKDEEVIKVIGEPGHNYDQYENWYTIEVLPKFGTYMNRLYTRYSFGVDKLDDLSLLRVYDVGLDVRDELRLTDEDSITIRIIPPAIRFRALFPGDSIPMREEYARHRWNAMRFLAKMGAFTKCELNDDSGQPYSTLAEITVNRLEFDRIFEKLAEKYHAINPKKQPPVEPASETPKVPTQTIPYTVNEQDATVEIQGKTIKLKKETRKFEFLKKLISQPEGIYYAEAAAELEGAIAGKNPRNTYYETCPGIQSSFTKVGITDFLIFDYTKAQINPLYKKEVVK